MELSKPDSLVSTRVFHCLNLLKGEYSKVHDHYVQMMHLSLRSHCCFKATVAMTFGAVINLLISVAMHPRAHGFFLCAKYV